MLIQYASVAALDAATKSRLRQALPVLSQTTEAAQGHVMFDGKYYRLSEVMALGNGGPQLLQEKS
jgi:hypothetical protein